MTRENKTAIPPKLFDLTSLQREANRIYGYTAKQTLDLAQTLYEKKLLDLSENGQQLSDRRHGRHSGEHRIALLCGKLPFMAGAAYDAGVFPAF